MFDTTAYCLNACFESVPLVHVPPSLSLECNALFVRWKNKEKHSIPIQSSCSLNLNRGTQYPADLQYHNKTTSQDTYKTGSRREVVRIFVRSYYIGTRVLGWYHEWYHNMNRDWRRYLSVVMRPSEISVEATRLKLCRGIISWKTDEEQARNYFFEQKR